MVAVFLFIGAPAHAIVLESGIPGVGGSGAQGAPIPDLPTYINYLYIFVLGFVGIAGFISLVIWGTVWVGSAVVDKKAMAMEGIKNTLTGIGIALTAFIMLYTINPDLTLIKDPTAPEAAPAAKSTQQALVHSTGASGLEADGTKCAPLTPCYPGSTCEGSIQDAKGQTTTMGTCTRIAAGIPNNLESSCAAVGASSLTCVNSFLCKYCAMPNGTKRCINKNNPYTTSCAIK